ncbi:MAG: hypothetical protein C0434_13080 [Xanthomonadaceae bacterium]|nr:hypothetical protein [Xanthomonadaceae bacterium]
MFGSALLALSALAGAQPLRPEAAVPAPAPTVAPTAAGSMVYRCQALDGSTLFQDRPCNQTAATREAQQGREGRRIDAAAPPPAGDGAAVAARYRRYLDQVEADRRINAEAEADAARAARLRAEAELEAARRPAAEPERDADRDRWLPVYLPYRGRPIRRPPVVEPPPAPPPGPRPTRPVPREPRDVRAEILDTRR